MIKFGDLEIKPKINFYSGNVKIDILGYRGRFSGIDKSRIHNIYAHLIEDVGNKYQIREKLEDRFGGVVDINENKAAIRDYLKRLLYQIEDDDKVIIAERLNFLLNKEVDFSEEEHEYFKVKFSKL
jgi:hypothetical protein